MVIDRLMNIMNIFVDSCEGYEQQLYIFFETFSDYPSSFVYRGKYE